MSRLLTLTIFLSLTTVTLSNRGKYSKSKNKPPELNTNPFRMNKINIVWEKAQSMLKPAKLDELFKVSGLSYCVGCKRFYQGCGNLVGLIATYELYLMSCETESEVVRISAASASLICLLLDSFFNQALKRHDEKEIEYKHSKVNGREDEEGELKADLLRYINLRVSANIVGIPSKGWNYS